MSTEPTPEPPRDPGGVTSLDMDKVSLEQALRDFEIANARVVDLTQRLITLTKQLQDTQDEVERLRVEARLARTEADTIRNSKAYRTAQQLGQLRALIRL